jgi:hypothetical protein
MPSRPDHCHRLEAFRAAYPITDIARVSDQSPLQWQGHDESCGAGGWFLRSCTMATWLVTDMRGLLSLLLARSRPDPTRSLRVCAKWTVYAFPVAAYGFPADMPMRKG